MKKKSDPRRPYVRADQFLVCFDGKYYGKAVKQSAFNKEGLISIALDETGVSVLKPSGGKRRIQVTQGEVVETWREQNVVFKPHAAKIPTVEASSPAPEATEEQ